MNLPTTGGIIGRGLRGTPVSTRVRRLGLVRDDMAANRAAAVIAAATLVVMTCAILEAFNFRNGWLAYEDLMGSVGSIAASVALWMVARRHSDHVRFHRTLAFSMSMTAFGQTLACVPDVIGQTVAGAGAVSDVAYVVGSVTGFTALLVTLYGRLQRQDRVIVVLNGLVIIAAAMTFVFANWIHQSFLPGSQAADYFADPTANLFLPIAASLFFSSAAAAVVAALSLRIEPTKGGVWSIALGIVLMSYAWAGWLGRFIAGTPDSIEPMDVVFPVGALLVAWGGATWTLRTGGGERYQRFATFTSTWLPVLGITGCAIVDVMPRSRPLLVDPVAVGTCTVVFLAVARQAILQRREHDARDRLTSEMSERAATTVSLANLEAGSTIEESAERICREALRIDGIDTVIVFGFTPSGVVPLAQAGPPTRPMRPGVPLPDDAALVIEEHAAFGLWLENWSSKAAPTNFERQIIASGLIAEAMAPLLWNDELVGVLALGATEPRHARRLSDRLATLTEFSVMSAAILGPALADRAQRETTIAEVRAVIATRAFQPVFQPIVDLSCHEFVGYESLARFADGTRPDLRFLEADKVGMMVELERAVLREQIIHARKLPKGSFLTLNVSPALAIEPDPLIELLRMTDRPVVLEVTEHVEIADYPKLLAALARVRPMAMLAVDDAGAGYAGLRHILELRPQYVKLDISLVRNIDTDPARQAMVTGMAHFATGVGCSLIAEGIETANELTTLRLLRIPYGQGYHLARPAPVE